MSYDYCRSIKSTGDIPQLPQVTHQNRVARTKLRESIESLYLLVRLPIFMKSFKTTSFLTKWDVAYEVSFLSELRPELAAIWDNATLFCGRSQFRNPLHAGCLVVLRWYNTVICRNITVYVEELEEMEVSHVHGLASCI